VTARPAPPIVTSSDIGRLVRFDSHGARVLSVYLDLQPERQANRAYRIVFKDLVKAARDRLDEVARNDLEAEARTVEAWLEDEQPSGLGMAMFSSAAADLREVYALPVPVPDRLSFEVHPLVLPLLNLNEDLERYVVAVVDKESARLITVFEGTIESVEAFTDDVPGKHDAGGPAQARLQRHHETHVVWHVKRVVQRLSELIRDRPFDRLVLAGPPEATTEVRHRLPRELERRLVATVPAERFATDAEILRMTLDIGREVELETEAGIVAAVIDGWRSNGPAACGMSSTLEALWLRQIRTLVIADGLAAPGTECPVDGRLDVGEPGSCPMCGAVTLPVGDVVDRAAQLTLEQDGNVEIVHEAAAERLRDACDGLGAVLRFRPRPS
jgi:peptide chain release factor subunit 1